MLFECENVCVCVFSCSIVIIVILVCSAETLWVVLVFM